MTLTDDDTDVVWLTVPLSAVTAARLRDLSNDCHSAPDRVAASLLHDVLADDAEAHHDHHVPLGTPIH